jgi:corrinoid protein of di/trimethylamine methyltransferase
MASTKKLLEELAESVIVGDASKAEFLAKEALNQKIAPYRAIMDGCGRGMEVCSEKFEKHEYYVPDLLIAARAMNAAIKILKPHIKADQEKVVGKIVLGTVEGDVHDIGKNVVKILLEAAGFEVIDLGNDVSTSAFINAINEHEPEIVGLSTLMSPTMLTMEAIIAELNKQSLRSKFKIIVGGAPVTAEYAKEIGADGYAEDAAKAVNLIKKLLA